MSTTDWVCRLMGTAQPPPVTEVADGSTRAERSTEATPSFETPPPPMSMNELIRARPQIELGHLEIEVKVTSTLERQSFSAQRVSAVLSSAAGLQQPVAWHNDPPRAAFRFGSRALPDRARVRRGVNHWSIIAGRTVTMAAVSREAWSALS
jgi:hypothetical protein